MSNQTHPVNMRIIAHVVEPVKVPDSPESATRLKVPADFRVTRFADGLGNPRMIAVADDARICNTAGFAWHPTTGELWGMDHGIDWLGDNDQKEELNLLAQGKQ